MGRRRIVPNLFRKLRTLLTSSDEFYEQLWDPATSLQVLADSCWQVISVQVNLLFTLAVSAIT